MSYLYEGDTQKSSFINLNIHQYLLDILKFFKFPHKNV